MDGFNEFAPIRRLALRHARDAFTDAAMEADWRRLGYLGRPHRDRALVEYDRFAELAGAGAQVDLLPAGEALTLDAIYVRDALVVAPGGIVQCTMGKAARAAEPALARAHLEARGMAVLGAIGDARRLEGGDVVWFDRRTVAVGHGRRTDADGIARLMTLLGRDSDVVVVPLPDVRVPGDVFHLMSVISPLDRDLALVFAPLLPAPFRQWLERRGMRLLAVPDEEFEGMGANVLATAPRRAVMLAGNPRTRALLEDAGVAVAQFEGAEICRHGAGGPTCLARPLVRG